ncbi:class I adenylate-forming enzyme family protein [Nocardioides sp. LHG3406-4]|uniref:class I adenylate-forming enzyme family protein n=1 Tax=Nocardioides sp. LHG3406-4 TaxID=2804575 RepID=UPI003CE73681
MLAERLREQAAAQGDRSFLLFEDTTISWRTVEDVVARTAALLRARGVGRGDRVLLAAENSPTFLYLWFALRWLGATCVPLHTAATTTAITRMVDDAGLSHVVGDAALLDRVLKAAPRLADRAVMFGDHEELERAARACEPVEPARTSRYDECNILYTSGTTGPPKGVVLSNESMLAGGRELVAALEITRDDRILLALPLFHTNPQVYGIMSALDSGCSIALLREFVPREFLAEAVRYDATGFTYVGTVLSLLTAKTEVVPDHSLRFCVGGGAPERLWREVEERLHVPVHELYGMTETGGWVTATRTRDRRPGTCGMVRPDMECVILDSDDVILPAGEMGQIAVRPSSPGVLFDGYHGRPDLTMARYTNAWFHTGDLGRFDEDGFLYFHGRADDIIRRAGENISPTGIEFELSRHPGIAEVAVVGVDDETMGQEVKVVIVPHAGFEVGTLLSFLEDRLPRFAWPRYVELRTELPKTPTQKIRVGELRGVGDDVVDLRELRPTTEQKANACELD